MVVFKLNGGHPTRNIILAVSLLAVFVILIFNFCMSDCLDSQSLFHCHSPSNNLLLLPFPAFGRDDSPPAPAHEEETKYVSPRIPTGLKDPVIDTAIQGHNVITSAIFTSWYTSFALLLAYTIRKYNDISKYNAEMVLMVIRKSEQEPDGITERDAEVLQNAGWILRDVEPLKWDSVDLSKIPPNHRTTLNKLHVWNWTEYDRVLYIDADCVVKNEFSDLFRVPGLLAAASDITGDVFVVNSFNAGVLSLRPSRTIFDDYLKKIPSMHLPHEGDQPFLQECVFPVLPP